MQRVDKQVLKEASHRLLFDMSDEEYETLLKEFDVITKQMDFISCIEGVDETEPMAFPYEIYTDELREDKAEETLTQEEALKNAHDVYEGMIRLPKVVK